MGFIEILKTIIIGIVEGITEWLPISSTGHMILVEDLMPLNQSEAFMDMFNVVIQLGAIMAVVVFFFHKLNPFSFSKTRIEKKDTWMTWLKVLVGCIPAGVIGILADDFLDEHFYNSITVSITLIIYGICFILIEKRKNPKIEVENIKALTFKYAFIIGCIQVLSLIPGTSRSGVTILGAMLLGCSRTSAAEYSFFLSIPIMFGASLIKIMKFGFDFSSNEIIILLIGCITAFLVSMVAIKFLMNFIKKHDFKPFGVYRIILGIIVLVYFISK